VADIASSSIKQNPQAAAKPVASSSFTLRDTKGFHVYEPANGAPPDFYLVYVHGVGGIGDDIRVLLDLLGKYKTPVTVVAPIAKYIMPKAPRLTNVRGLVDVMRFLKSFPSETQKKNQAGIG